MIKTHFLLFIRNILGQKVYFLINFCGLLLTITAVTFLMLYLERELSYDGFHSESNLIYRITNSLSKNGKQQKLALVPGNIKDILDSSEGDVSVTTKVLKYVTHPVFKANEKSFTEDNGYFVDRDFNRVFNFKFLNGNATTAFEQPNAVAISQKLALKYFQTTDVLEKQISIDLGEGTGAVLMQVSGVFEEMPTNSHLQFDYLISGKSLSWWNEASNDGIFYIYCKVTENATQSTISKIEDIIEQKSNERLLMSGQRLAANEFYKYPLQPLSKIHFDDSYLYDVAPTVNLLHLVVLAILALMMFVVGAINYFNLTSVFYIKRLREISICKFLGFKNYQFTIVWFAESVLLSLLIMICVIGILYYGIKDKSVREIIGVNSLSGHWHVLAASYLLVLTICASVMLFLGRMVRLNKPNVFAGGLHFKSTASTLLVALQMLIAMTLIGVAFIISNQFQYVREKDIGFEKSGLILVTPPGSVSQGTWNEFIKRLKSEPLIAVAGQSSFNPFETYFSTSITLRNQDKSESIKSLYTYVDDKYVQAIGMTIISGENFSDKWSFDKPAAIVNETALKEIGVPDLVGKEIMSHALNGFNKSTSATVVGVVKDFHTASFEKKIEPVVFVYTPAVESIYKLIVKPSTIALSSTISKLQEHWKKAGVEASFDYSLIEEGYNKSIKNVSNLSTTIIIFSTISILISLIGTVALVGGVALQRSKEISIRKVLGASVLEILILINRNLALTFIGCSAVALVISYFIGMNWLSIFAYRATINTFYLALISFSVLVFILTVVSFQSLRAASKKPIENLRTE